MVKKSPENTTPAIVDNVEALEAKLAQMREAQALFATYTQEHVGAEPSFCGNDCSGVR